jgi:hypothetical protein
MKTTAPCGRSVAGVLPLTMCITTALPLITDVSWRNVWSPPGTLIWVSTALFHTRTILMLCDAWVLMLTLKTTSLSSCVVATILGGASCYDLAPIYFLFHHVPHYVLPITPS